MKNLLIACCFLLIASPRATGQQPTVSPQKGWSSKYVSLNPDGSLRYHPDAKGNIIPDFSRVGYHQGDREIPQVPVVKTVQAAKSGSSQEIIQRAIDEVSARTPDNNGFRGAILLEKGTYLIPGSLVIKASGVVLRGKGDNAEGSKLVATGQGKRSLLEVQGHGRAKEVPGTRTRIADAFVPTGAMSFKVVSAAGLKVGDNIILFRPGTANWIADLKMNQIEARENTRQWQAEDYDLHFQRTITQIKGNEVFLDNPVVMEMDTKYGGGEIYKYTFDDRITEVGVENLYFESEFNGDEDENHGWVAVEFNRVENGWVRNVTSRYFGYSCVSLGNDAKQITVLDSKSLDPKSIITGGRRYSFNNDGQLNLFMNLHAESGRHDYVTGQKVLGPNVFYNSMATNAQSDIGPHHRWAVGTLYDNITTDGEINIQDRGNWGSGHGWAGVTQVIWNSQARKIAVQSPWVSGKNYAVGLQGQKVEGRLKGRPDGEWEGLNQTGVQPQSLYRAQLEARQAKSLK